MRLALDYDCKCETIFAPAQTRTEDRGQRDTDRHGGAAEAVAGVGAAAKEVEISRMLLQLLLQLLAIGNAKE